MNAPAPNAVDGISSSSAAELVQAMLRFLRLMQHRKSYLLTSLAIAGLLGTIYLATAPKTYQASAALLVTQIGPDTWNTSITPDGGREASIPTFEKLFSYPVVLEEAIHKLVKRPAAARVDFVDVPREGWIDVIGGNLQAVSVRRTNIIDLSYRSRSPQAAEAVLDTIVQSYLEFIEKNHKNLSLEYVTILEQKRQEKEDELKSTQAKLLVVQRQAGDLGLRSGATVVHPLVQRAVKLNEAYVDVQKDRLQLEAMLSAIKIAVKHGGDLREHLLTIEPIVGRELLMHVLGLDPQYTQMASEVERKLLENQARLKMLSKHYGPTHPEVIELEQGIQNSQQYLLDYQAKINTRLDSVRDGRLGPMLTAFVDEKLVKARAHEAELQRQYEVAEREAIQLNDRMAELQILENNLQRLRSLHDTLLDRIANIDIKQNHADVRVALLSEPKALGYAVSPRFTLIFLLCVTAGLGGGASIVYLLDLLDDRFRSPDEMKAQLGVPLLGIVRRLPTIDENGLAALQVHVSPESVESEAFRTLRTALSFSGAELNRLAVTSAEPGDGKTTVSSNLAMAYAQAGKRTLIIDADLRRPGMTKLFDLRRMGGLSEILRTDGDVAAMCRQRIQQTGCDMLHVLPCGPKPQNPAELLSHARFAEVIAWAETEYDQILIDCPPVMAASDAAIVGRQVDGVVLVVQPAKNHRRIVTRAAESLTSIRVNLVGIVANRISDDAKDGYYTYEYGYSYGYGHGYGHRRVDEEHERQEDPVPAANFNIRTIVRRRAA
jgi:capsular exopolysaccharide synthesis family protein